MISLASYTTLGLGGPARSFAVAATDEDLVAAVAADGPVLILGGGSNLVVSDDGFPGTVVQVATRGIRLNRGPGDHVDVTAAAGEPWDDVVNASVIEGLAGLECLSGIPGLAGATPIQNVGAYGQEVADVITAVRVFDRRTAKSLVIPNAECGFGYRTSMFKAGGARADERDRYIVLDVTFRLTEQKLSGPVRYPDLAAKLGVQPGEQVPAADARAAVIAVRRRKGMVIDPADPDTRSAGSFFTNPVLPAAEFARVAERAHGPVPSYQAGDGRFKIPAAWLIEHSGFTKGYASHGARISTKHTLALTNPGNATTAGLLALAREIRDGVAAAYGVTLEPEPTLIGATL